MLQAMTMDPRAAAAFLPPAAAAASAAAASAAAAAAAAVSGSYGLMRLPMPHGPTPEQQLRLHHAAAAAAAAQRHQHQQLMSMTSPPPPGHHHGMTAGSPMMPSSSSPDQLHSSSNSSYNSSTCSSSSGVNSSGGDPPMSRTHQYKKIMKPLLERKRRARINKCLDELKDIMTVALQAQGENVSKLEKADILELTVRHLHKLQQAHKLMGGPERNPLEEVQRFQAGYSSCAQEAATFLMSAPGVDVRVSQRLLSHLSTNIANPLMAASATSPPLHHSNASTPIRGGPIPHPEQPLGASPILHNNNNNNISSPLKRHLNGFHSPPPRQCLRTVSPLPPRPNSNPGPKTFKSEVMSSGEDEEEDSLEETETTTSALRRHRRRGSLPDVVKPEPIRINPNDPVWRPF